ncbi:MAG: hypothetical protein ACFFDN_49565 [Candidatus Hodarchaeota archaeon]
MELRIKVVQQAVIPIISLIVAIIALYYNRLKLRIKLFTAADQVPGEIYIWSVKLSISNSGFTPFSIVRVTDKEEKEIRFSNSNEKLPIKFDPGDIKSFNFRYEYSTKSNYIFAFDHRGKRHKIKICKRPPLLIPDTFKDLLTNPNYRTFVHFKRFLAHKFKKY